LPTGINDPLIWFRACDNIHLWRASEALDDFSSAKEEGEMSQEEENYSEEYASYLERYEFFSEGQPKLSPQEFERLDDELLDLLAMDAVGQELTEDQEERYLELMYLLVAE
jgi:hypothetical protein